MYISKSEKIPKHHKCSSKKKLEPFYTVGGNVNGIVTMENSMATSQEITRTNYHMISGSSQELPHDPEILLWDIYPKELKPGSQKYSCTPMSIAAVYNSQHMKTT